jgi:predicted anti-sigma-YlaC factor YlaD
VSHISDETLEQYAMRALPRVEIELVEEHMLVCSECRDRLQSMDEYVAAMRAETIRKNEERAKRPAPGFLK